MWRFILPAFAMTAALIVLFAGALGDLHSWPNLSDKALTIIGVARRLLLPLRPHARLLRPRHHLRARRRRGTAGGARRPAAPGRRLQRQAGEPQQQNAHARTTWSKARMTLMRRARRLKSSAGIEALRQQRTAEQTAPATAIAQQQAERDALQRQIADLQRQSGELNAAGPAALK